MTEIAIIDGPRGGPTSGRRPTSMVILAHGYGSNGDDLIGLASYWSRALPDTVFIAPNAPQVCPGAPDGYQWWPVWDVDRRTGLESAAPVLDAFIDAELARYDLTDDRLALVGFSQGTMMALSVAPRRSRCLAGVVGYSGMMIEPAPGDIVTRPPVLLVHGAEDPMIPIAAFHRSEATLREHGFAVSSHICPGLGHSIDMDGLKLGEAFLSEHLT